MSMSKPPPHLRVKKLLRKLLIEEIVNEPSLEEIFTQFEFDPDLDMVPEQAKVLLDSTPKIQPKNG
jgi:hypothetical protein